MEKIQGFKYSPSGVCPRELDIVVDTEDKTISDICFKGGCSGNHRGLCALIKGMNINEASDKLKGIKCGDRETSCPDQLSKALKEIDNIIKKSD
jgi:uncharacterized protein (TIGR03905 family)